MGVSVAAGLAYLVAALAMPAEEYATGMTLVRPGPACPLYVVGVVPGSPANRAGLRPGDRLVSIDGKPAGDRDLLSSQAPQPVAIGIVRSGESMTIRVGREPSSNLLRKQGLERVEDLLVPIRTSREEVNYLKSFEVRDITSVVFPDGHYPRDMTLYYPGFEVFLLKDLGPTVGGIENGPAKRAGVEYGDVVMSIDGVVATDKSAAELEALLSGREARRVVLVLERLGKRKRCEFILDRADGILAANGMQVVRGKHLPAAIPAAELECAFQGPE